MGRSNMNSLKRILEDIKRGENIDLYLTVVMAIVVAVLNLFGFASSALLSSLSLAIFALIASAILGNRHRLDDIQDKLITDGGTKITDTYPESRDEDVANASEIWWFGVHAIVFLRKYRKVIEQKIKKGIKVHVLLVDPDGKSLGMVAARNPGKPSTDREKASILTSLSDLCELKAIAPAKLEIRIIDDPIMYGGCMLNPDKANGIIYIQRYTYQTGIRPRFTYRPKSEWFEFTKSEILSLWNRGKEWKCESTE